ncbi:MAG: 3-deoxy-8-phosphooctulonate synthase [Candidatus Gastranaerophilales bacterium]|nr:3-deoxy-8-phosphooctulonate synthase [Candidatus Gastranaerophilales bacterium]
MLNKVKINDNVVFGNDKLVIIAGPCAMEEDVSITLKTAEELKKITQELDIPFVFKSSFDKANRSSIDSYRGIGLEKGLELLAKVKQEFGVPVLTDIHSVEQASLAAEAADILQIPAFLCRQTDLLVAAAKTGRVVNIKKGQFLAPSQMKNSIKKVTQSGNDKILLTERGSTFGYGNLVVDMRAIPIMRGLGYPVVFDATHSVQLPGGNDVSTGGERQFVPTLAKAAVAAGADALFFEVHPDPDNAPCDGPNMIPISQARELFTTCKDIFNLIRN